MENETTINTTTPSTQMAGTKTTIENGISNTATTVFTDEMEGTILQIPDAVQDISSMDHIGVTDINDFFSRPVRIYSATWANAAIGATLSPWHLYLNNSTVLNKIRNYAYLRAKLHLKVVVNSSPFYYGALQLAYYPYALEQACIHYGINGFARTTKVPAGLRPYLQSTLPNIVLESGKCKGGEMVLPFIYDRNFLDLRTSTGVQRMGILSFQELAPLTSASSGTASAHVVIYAWMEDVILTGATNQTVLQADAYGTGPVSKPASVVAAIAGKLTNAPFIGPYARATNIAASAVGKIASMFGYSNVPLIEPIRHVRNTGIGNCASSEIGSHIEKLSLDPKNELSIDPRIVGAEEDDMQLSRITSREGIISLSSWLISSPADTSIWNCKVNPNFCAAATANSVTATYLPPIAHAAQCFAFWRGDIVFRFKLIKTKYHKGRLRISWDTIGQPNRSATEFVTSLTAIWDIAETDEFEFRVPYQNETAFLPTYPSLSPDNVDTSVNPTVSENAYSNGILSITVVNSLTAPVDVASATIIAYVRAADNFELAGPKNPLSSGTECLNYSFLEPQSETVTIGFKKDNNEADVYAVHYGEVVKSIKVLMYRTNWLCTMGQTGATAGNRNQITRPRLPLFYGYDVNGISSAKTQGGGSTVSFNWVRTTPYHWFTPAYVFQRGSHNYRLNFWDAADIAFVTRVPYLSETGTTNNSWRSATSTSFDTTGRGLLISNPIAQPAGAGTSVSIPDVNQVLEFSLPLYSRYRAVTCMPESVNMPPYAYQFNNLTLGTYSTTEENARSGSNLEGWVASVVTAGDVRHDLFHSVGIDFGLFFYKGCPALYSISTPAAG